MSRFYLLLGYFFILTNQIHAQSAQAIAYYQKANTLFEENKPNEALETLNKAIAESPQYQEAILLRARYYTDKNIFDRGLDDFSTLLQLAPAHLPYLLERGLLLQKAENFDEAETDFLTALEKDSTNIDVLNALGGLYQEAELSTDALKYLDKAIAIDGKDYDTRYRRAWVYLESKKYTQCLEDLKVCENLKTDDNNVLRFKALCYVRQKKYDEAIKIYDVLSNKKIKLIEQDFLYWGMAYYEKRDYKNALFYLSAPQEAEFSELYHYVGKTYYKLNDTKNALIKLDSALIICKNIAQQEGEISAPIYYNRAIIHHKAGKTNEAKADLLRALYLTPELIAQKDYQGDTIAVLEDAVQLLKPSKNLLDSIRLKGHQDRAESLILSGETNRAWAELQKCHLLDSLHAKNMVLYAKISLLVGKFQDAFMYLEKAEKMTKGKSEEDIAYLRAIAYQEKGQFTEAKIHIKKAIEKSETDGSYYSVLGSIEFESANPKGALEAINKAIKMQPQIMDYYIERAIYQQNLGNFEEVIKDCNKVLENEKDNPEAFYQRGLAYKATKRYKEALTDFQKAELYNNNDTELKALIKEMKEKK